jgi:hypothetical protein
MSCIIISALPWQYSAYNGFKPYGYREKDFVLNYRPKIKQAKTSAVFNDFEV